MTGIFRPLALVLALALVFPALALCRSKPSLVLKAATLAPKKMGWARQVADNIVPLITECSEGDIRLKVYYGGIMGDDREMIEKMGKGVLQAAGVGGRGAIRACPEFSVVSLPFLFQGYDELDYIREKMTPEFDRLCQANGFQLVLWVDQDFDQVYSSKYPMNRLEDFKNSVFMTYYGLVEEKLLSRLGARQVALNVPRGTEAMRTGQTDAAIAPALYVLGNQMYAVVKYINPLKIRYAPVVIIMTNEAWNRIPQPVADCILARRPGLTADFVTGTRKGNERALMAMRQYGIKMVEMNARDVALFQAQGRPVWEELVGVMYSRDLLDQVKGHLADFRGAAKGKSGQ